MFKLSFDRALSVMLLFIPVSIALDLLHVDPILVFLSAGLVIVPLAGFMGKGTEEV
jgi:Ca2+:H+ antiporter